MQIDGRFAASVHRLHQILTMLEARRDHPDHVKNDEAHGHITNRSKTLTVAGGIAPPAPIVSLTAPIAVSVCRRSGHSSDRRTARLGHHSCRLHRSHRRLSSARRSAPYSLALPLSPADPLRIAIGTATTSITSTNMIHRIAQASPTRIGMCMHRSGTRVRITQMLIISTSIDILNCDPNSGHDGLSQRQTLRLKPKLTTRNSAAESRRSAEPPGSAGKGHRHTSRIHSSLLPWDEGSRHTRHIDRNTGRRPLASSQL